MSLSRLLVVLVSQVGLHATLLAEPPDQPTPRPKVYPWMTLEKWHDFHDGDLARAKEGRIDELFLGDFITEAWEKNGAKVWEEFMNEGGTLPAEIMSYRLHPSEKGYVIRAEAMLPTLQRHLAAP